MRLFIALELPDDLKDRLAGLKTPIPAANWVKRDGYHLTLSFLGEVEPARVPALTAALSSIQSPSFSVTLRGAGRFPPKGSARVLWIGTEAQPALRALQKQVEQALVSLGFPPEDRPFSAHITLARLKSDARREVEAFLEQHRDWRADPFPVSAFHLIESTLTPQGAHYRIEQSFALK
ncbi:MAG: RNA 2',3'-cyclic phosphodiesterase [Anaerolineae bacterium]|nr:RNA 2',3'-cyclic phosphodiesterase [Anaerolineae bacterium]